MDMTPEAVTLARKFWPIKRTNQNDKRTLEQRFFGALAFDASDCWYWRGSHTNLGYGVFKALGQVRAHRVAWVLMNGPIPKGMHVLHKCDVRCCVNPEHLFLGTHEDNMRDMVKKGRGKSPGLCGEQNPVSKLTSSQVQMIRDEYSAGGVTQHQLAQKYGVTQMTINRAVNFKTWVQK